MKKKLLFIACASSFCLPYSTAVMAEEKGGFLEDSKITFHARNVWLDHNEKNMHDNGARSGENREWGQAFIVTYESGFTQGTVGFGLDAVGIWGIKLDSDGHKRTAGQLLPLKRNGKSKDQAGSFGVSAKIKISKTIAQYGDTLRPSYPVLKANDGRLMPQIFRGGVITSKEITGLTVVAGKFENAKGRASTDMQPFAVGGSGKSATGKIAASNKFYFGGLDYSPIKDLSLAYYYGNLKDFYRQHYVGAKYNIAAGPGVLTPEVRYWYSTSDGKNGTAKGRGEGYTISTKAGSNHKGEVDNRAVNLMLSYSIMGNTILASFQDMSGRSAFPYVNQGNVGGGGHGSSTFLANDQLISNFANAGERSWMISHTFDFKEVGVPGLYMINRYIKGFNIQQWSGANKTTKEWERDFVLGYKFLDGSLKGLQVEYRNAVRRANGHYVTDRVDNRIYVNYIRTFDKF